MSVDNLIRIFTSEEARATILVRRPQDEAEATPETAERIRQIFGAPLTPDQVVEKIIRDVRDDGDEAIKKYTRLLDGTECDAVQVAPEDLDAAVDAVSEPLRQALHAMAARIRTFHERQPKESWCHWDEEGGIGHIVRPLDRVGVYVPGGQAAYPSSLLMAVIPARVAGVKQIVVATPPDEEGHVPPAVLAASRIAGVDTVYRVGGAAAIAAMAYGTPSVPRVDKIVGPGNIFVVLAKRRVYGVVDIDQLPGPTETMLIADDTANPSYAAADMLAQAEHDPMASAILLTPSRSFAKTVQQDIAYQVKLLERASIIKTALSRNSGIVITQHLDEAFELANAYAPEHLCLLVEDAWAMVGRIRHAGGIFVGEHASEALGDYIVGPSHIMPTGGTARFASVLSVRDFLKISGLFGVNARASLRLGNTAITLAEAEGLTAHAAAISRRMG